MASQQFYDYFQREMSYLRSEGAQFAQSYPKVARRLDFNNVEAADPHVERLLQSFAFLTARLQRDVEDLFPRISTALLNAIYPQFLAPLPSFTIAKFDLNDDKGKLTARFPLQKGTDLFARASDGEVCRFQVGAETDIYPLVITNCDLILTQDLPTELGFFSNHRVLRIQLRSTAGPMNSLDLRNLRLYINSDAILQNKLYEALFLEDGAVAYSFGNYKDPTGYVASRQTQLSPAGFDEHDALMPFPDHGHPGYHLLQEYFAYTQKFMFFDVGIRALSCDQKEATLYVEIADEVDVEAKDIGHHTFALGCIPIINIFNTISEPIRIDHKKVDYRLIGDQRREDTVEVHTIKKVYGSVVGSAQTLNFSPFFSYTHADFDQKQDKFWTARRIYSPNLRKPGNDVLLSFVDYDFNPARPSVDTIYAELLCTNRQLALSLPSGTLLHSDSSLPAPTLYTIDRPTPPRYINRETQSQWRLISHLCLGHFALSDPHNNVSLLRELIKLYGDFHDGRGVPEIDAVRDLNVERVVRRTGQEAWRGFAQGSHFTLTIEEGVSRDTSAFLFAAVLDRVFSQFASVNSFTQLAIKKANQKQVWKEWIPRSGNKALV